MTIKQYQKLAKTIADKIETDLGGNPNHVRHLTFGGGVTVCARDPKMSDDAPTTFESGKSNIAIEFDTLSNPNNPNYKFKTLKAGSISAYNSGTRSNVDLTEYNFDSSQFKELIDAVSQVGWTIAC